jgi:hypothetical protein
MRLAILTGNGAGSMMKDAVFTFEEHSGSILLANQIRSRRRLSALRNNHNGDRA